MMDQVNQKEMVENGGEKRHWKILLRYWPLLLVIVCIIGIMLGYYIKSLDNSVVERATKLQLNKLVRDNLKDNFDQNWYTVTLPADGYISLQLNHNKLDSDDYFWQMHMYYENKRDIVLGYSSCWLIPGDQNELTAEIGLPAGTYYIRIRPYGVSYDTSTYGPRVNYTQSDTCETEDNDAFNLENADIISINTDYTGSIMTERDNDLFLVTLPEDGYVTMQFSHPYLDSDEMYWYMSLYETEEGTLVDGARWAISGNENVLTAKRTLKAGAYYVRIGSYSRLSYDNSTYTFRVNFEPMTLED